jgi:hypothetical protein
MEPAIDADAPAVAEQALELRFWDTLADGL